MASPPGCLAESPNEAALQSADQVPEAWRWEGAGNADAQKLAARAVVSRAEPETGGWEHGEQGAGREKKKEVPDRKEKRGQRERQEE